MAEQAETQEATTEGRGRSRIMQGTVRSNSMDKTVIVEVTHRVRHKVYKKYVTRRVRYHAHDERNEYLPGDIVRMISCRPLSRHKRWRVQQLIERPA
ncbi:MAG: 30S ribosomal protein S17 [Proteobacteria bacterium]|nr:MAG: 30S ribosomal protein S17 [Pseudomonadota bacterium]PIE17866.1 MAG: 30S ribosomal protein S17 [Pseudomonadota bacterium]